MMKNSLRILLLIIFVTLLIGCTVDRQRQNRMSSQSLAPASDSVHPNPADEAGEVKTIATENVQRAPCAYAQDYWKTHVEAWPVQKLVLGNVTYQQDELLAILETPPRGNPSYALAHQLIAAKLSAAQGAPAPAAIGQANAWLAQNPLGGAPAGQARAKGLALARALAGVPSDRVDCGANGQSFDVPGAEANDYCNNGEPHPHALTLAQRYGISYEEIMQWSCNSFNFDDIERAYDLSLATAVPVQQIFDMRANSLAWREIAQTVGAAAQTNTDAGGASEGSNVGTAPDDGSWVSSDAAENVADTESPQGEQPGNGPGNTAGNGARGNNENNSGNSGNSYGKENNPGQSKAKGKE